MPLNPAISHVLSFTLLFGPQPMSTFPESRSHDRASAESSIEESRVHSSIFARYNKYLTEKEQKKSNRSAHSNNTSKLQPSITQDTDYTWPITLSIAGLVFTAYLAASAPRGWSEIERHPVGSAVGSLGRGLRDGTKWAARMVSQAVRADHTGGTLTEMAHLAGQSQ